MSVIYLSANFSGWATESVTGDEKFRSYLKSAIERNVQIYFWPYFT